MATDLPGQATSRFPSLSQDGYIKIVDFGLVKLLPRGGTASDVATVVRDGTTPGTVLGTASYMSPEQAKGQAADFRSDQFSLGAVIRDGVGRVCVLRRDRRGDAGRGLTLEPQLDGAIVMRYLQKSADRRWSSTDDLVAALRGAGQNDTSHLRSTRSPYFRSRT